MDMLIVMHRTFIYFTCKINGFIMTESCCHSILFAAVATASCRLKLIVDAKEGKCKCVYINRNVHGKTLKSIGIA